MTEEYQSIAERLYNTGKIICVAIGIIGVMYLVYQISIGIGGV
jgi:hypothetical protein